MMQHNRAKTLVLTYLKAMERRNLTEARACIGAHPVLVFPGGRVFSSIDQIAGNSNTRYRLVKKNIERVDAWSDGSLTMVLVSGTLFGKWPDGTSFSGIRFADRLEISGGHITRQEVWNDAGEHVLARQKGTSNEL